MLREQLEQFTEAVENLARNDLIELAGMWRQDIDRLMATYTKIDEEGLQSERATEAAPNKAAWVSPDPRLLFHLPLDLAVGFVETAKQVLSSDERSLDSAFAEWGVRRIFSEQCLVVASPGRLLHHGRAGYLRGMPVLVQQRPRWSRPGGGCCPGGSFAKGDRCRENGNLRATVCIPARTDAK